MNGSYADTSFLEGDYEDGGEAINLNNGQSSPDTASYAEFYDDIRVIGGDAPGGVGGNALHGKLSNSSSGMCHQLIINSVEAVFSFQNSQWFWYYSNHLRRKFPRRCWHKR